MFPKSKINNVEIIPSRLSFNRPHSTKQDPGRHHLLDGEAIFASQKYFLTTLVLFDWSWVYAVPGTGRAFSSSARFLSDLLQPNFNSGLEANPQNYLSNCSFWPREYHPVSSEGLSQRPCCSGSWYPSGMGHCQPSLPHPSQPWGLLGDSEFPQAYKQALKVWDAIGQGYGA